MPSVNYSLDTNGANAQGLFVKDCTIAEGVWPKHGVAGIAYRDAQGNLIEYVPTPSSASGEG